MSSVTERSGAEGPRHDPYHFDEYFVRRPSGVEALLHVGLGTWAEVRWENGVMERSEVERAALDLFERAAGVSMGVLQRALQERQARKYRLHPCGLKFMRDAAGYPGESFVVCGKCGDVIDSHFDRSAIE